jgi:hypothetical protein
VLSRRRDEARCAAPGPRGCGPARGWRARAASSHRPLQRDRRVDRHHRLAQQTQTRLRVRTRRGVREDRCGQALGVRPHGLQLRDLRRVRRVLFSSASRGEYFQTRCGLSSASSVGSLMSLLLFFNKADAPPFSSLYLPTPRRSLCASGLWSVPQRRTYWTVCCLPSIHSAGVIAGGRVAQSPVLRASRGFARA